MAEVDSAVARENAEKILIPETQEHTICSHTIAMRPIPISIAKELRRYTDRLSQLTTEMGDQPNEKWGDIDVEAADVYVKATIRLLSFYKVTLTKEQVEELPLTMLKDFLQKQLNIQGDEDFLLEPLRRTIQNFSSPKGRTDGRSSNG